VSTPKRGDAVGLLRELVRCDSRNPSLVAGAPGEGGVAARLRDILVAWGFDARLQDAGNERPNVVARVAGSGGGRSLILNGHLDVVDVDGMTHPPFDADEREGRLYGRGSSDMKGGVAAMCAAAARLSRSRRGDVTIAAVVDEEWQSIGTRSLLATGLRADAAIVTEPTGLAVMPSHKGFAWLQVVVHGRAAHGSRWDIGVDAIRHAGLLLAELDRLEHEELSRRSHPLLGRASLHAADVEGGSGLSTYPDRCVFRIERRTLPGESAADALREVQEASGRVRASHPTFSADVELLFFQPPSDVPLDAPLVRAMTELLERRGLSTRPLGMSAWTDAALFNDAGIPAICFGPGDMGLAHAAEEYIETAQVEQASDILAELIGDWCA
jgi:acetylornithine deacetylase